MKPDGTLCRRTGEGEKQRTAFQGLENVGQAFLPAFQTLEKFNRGGRA